MTRHTLSVLVEDKPGVLARVASLFSRRGFNIDSLAVGPTERADRSVITIRVDCTRHSVDQVVKQLDKLIDVIHVIKVHPDMAIERELLLIKVKADANHRLEIMRLSEVFNARVVDAGADSLLLECVEHPDRLAALEQLLSPYTIVEAVRTGRVAMTRASVAHDESRAPLRILG